MGRRPGRPLTTANGHGQCCLLLNRSQHGQGIVYKTFNSAGSQLSQEAIEQGGHLLFTSVLVRRAVFESAAQSVGLIAPKRSITGHRGECDGGKGFSVSHVGWSVLSHLSKSVLF